MLTKDHTDVPVTQITAENYLVPANEKHLYHVKLEVRKFDENTGRRLSQPIVQKFGFKSFRESLISELKKQGYTVEILHDPKEYYESRRAAAAAQTQAMAEEAEKKKAEEEAAKEAKLRAEIEAQVRAEFEAKEKESRKSRSSNSGKKNEKKEAQAEAETGAEVPGEAVPEDDPLS